jgi:hypothetical protein
VKNPRLIALRNVSLSILFITLVGSAGHGFMQPVTLLEALTVALWFWWGIFVGCALFLGWMKRR